MTEIRAGEYVTNELSKNAMGGTELMAQRMQRDLDPELLKHFQIIHSRVRELDPSLKKILVLHDLSNDPETQNLTDPNYRKQFDKIVFVSNWQAQMFNLTHGIPYEEFVVIPNAIEKFPTPEKKYGGEIKLIYHTTPHRGLELLIPAFVELSKHFNVHLDVFSSFKAYGWEERDAPYKELFNKIDSLPNATYHGFNNNSTIRTYLQEAHIFAYPSIWPETSCIALMEALSAGCMAVHPNLAALPETAEHGTYMYQWNENKQKHLNEFYTALYHITKLIDKQPEIMKSVALTSASHYNDVNNWAHRVQIWNNLLRRLLNETSSSEQPKS